MWRLPNSEEFHPAWDQEFQVTDCSRGNGSADRAAPGADQKATLTRWRGVGRCQVAIRS
jgi:hypothetical protein